MSDQIIAILDDLSKRLGIAVDWTSTNVWPYAKELMQKIVRYELATSIAWIIISVICILLSIMAYKYLLKHPKKFIVMDEYDDESNHIRILFYIILNAIIFIFILIILRQSFDVIKCLTFPERVVFEYIKDILNSTTAN